MLKKTCIALMVVFMMAATASARMYKGVDMPETLQDGNYTLVLNGVGLRVVVLVIKPYVAGLYLMKAEKDPAVIMKADEPMAIRLQITFGVGRGTMLSKLYEGMHDSVASIGGNFSALKARYDKFKQLLPEPKFKDGDIYEFKYLPSKGLQVIRNGELKGTIEGLDFKEAFFGIWLNKDKPCDKDLKTAMLEGSVTQQALDTQKQYMAKVKLEKEKMKEDEAARAKAVAVAEAQKKAAEMAATKAEAAAPTMPKAPVVAMKGATAKAAARQAVAATTSVPMMAGDNNALAAAYLVNALNSARLVAALNGDKFDMEQETQKMIQMWKEMKQAISQ